MELIGVKAEMKSAGKTVFIHSLSRNGLVGSVLRAMHIVWFLQSVSLFCMSKCGIKD